MTIINPSGAVGAQVALNAATAIPTSTDYIVPWDTIIKNEDGIFNIANPTDLVIPFDGWYIVSAVIEYAANNTQYRQTRILVNGASTGYVNLIFATAQINAPSLSVAAALYLTSGDIVTIMGRQTTGGNLNITAKCSIVGLE